MKVMVIVKANADSEAGRLPSEAELAEMGAYNEQLVAAASQVQAGPFGPPSEQIAGFWLWNVRSLDEAIEWASRAPFGAGGTLELRQLITAEDFGEAFTPELQQQEQRLREQLEN
ncbi:dehydrogenase [Stenotrophomonas sp. SPM]|uniref:YciI family protein n=1 Tax=Stenotrophomonas sp. SPM TaxID=2170735 RepID=UPI000DE6A81A|nr:YciI family protein [Stenotrophomonas sp. SPM]PWB23145.1 dehydrogenase [Stenotrophomonas sp. SPM]